MNPYTNAYLPGQTAVNSYQYSKPAAPSLPVYNAPNPLPVQYKPAQNIYSNNYPSSPPVQPVVSNYGSTVNYPPKPQTYAAPALTTYTSPSTYTSPPAPTYQQDIIGLNFEQNQIPIFIPTLNYPSSLPIFAPPPPPPVATVPQVYQPLTISYPSLPGAPVYPSASYPSLLSPPSYSSLAYPGVAYPTISYPTYPPASIVTSYETPPPSNTTDAPTEPTVTSGPVTASPLPTHEPIPVTTTPAPYPPAVVVGQPTGKIQAKPGANAKKIHKAQIKPKSGQLGGNYTRKFTGYRYINTKKNLPIAKPAAAPKIDRRSSPSSYYQQAPNQYQYPRQTSYAYRSLNPYLQTNPPPQPTPATTISNDTSGYAADYNKRTSINTNQAKVIARNTNNQQPIHVKNFDPRGFNYVNNNNPFNQKSNYPLPIYSVNQQQQSAYSENNVAEGVLRGYSVIPDENNNKAIVRIFEEVSESFNSFFI